MNQLIEEEAGGQCPHFAAPSVVAKQVIAPGQDPSLVQEIEDYYEWARANPDGGWMANISQSPAYIDNMAEAISMDMSFGYLIKCRGLDEVIRIPFEYISDKQSEQTLEIGRIYPGRLKASLARDNAIINYAGHGIQSFYTFYQGPAGLIVPTTYSRASTPRIFEGIELKNQQMREAALDASQQLKGLALTMGLGRAVSYGLFRINKWGAAPVPAWSEQGSPAPAKPRVPVPPKLSSSTRARVLGAAMRGWEVGAPPLRGTGGGSASVALQRPHSAVQAPAEAVTTSPPTSVRPEPSHAPAAARTAQATEAPHIVPRTQPPAAVTSPQAGPSASQSGIELDRSGTWQANQPQNAFGMYSVEELSVETSPPSSATQGTSFERRNELTPEIMEAQRQRNAPEAGRALGSPGTAQHGDSESRSGMAFRQYDAAEVALSMRTDYSAEHGGYLRSVEFDVPEVTGNFGTRPGSFRQNDELNAIGVAHPAHEDLTNTGSERGHPVAQQLSAGDRDVARALMVTTNMWPMSGRGPTGVNQGAYKRFEEAYIALKADNPGSSVHVRVEAVVGSSPRFVRGTRGGPVLSPDAFNITVTFTPPPGGGPPIVVNFLLPN